MSEDILSRIRDYLGNGGLFNPEHMEHDKVRRLIMDCREELTKSAATIEAWQRIHKRGDATAIMTNKIDGLKFQKLVSEEIKIHRTSLHGKSGESPEWEKAFIQGLAHARLLLSKFRRSQLPK